MIHTTFFPNQIFLGVDSYNQLMQYPDIISSATDCSNHLAPAGVKKIFPSLSDAQLYANI